MFWKPENNQNEVLQNIKLKESYGKNTLLKDGTKLYGSSKYLTINGNIIDVKFMRSSRINKKKKGREKRPDIP